MIYLDNAATTPLSEAVRKAMTPYLYEDFGNASSVYTMGIAAKEAVNYARHKVAELINAKPEEIYFTSGGTESNNWAIKGAFDYKFLQEDKNEIITSTIEHPSVLNVCGYLDYYTMADIRLISCNEGGRVCYLDIEPSITANTALVSIMMANNEIGTIQEIEQIGAVCRKNNVLFHTDAVQAFGHIPIDVKKMNIDMLSASGHKIHAPKGVGCLYIRKGIEIEPFFHGGHQEDGFRAGTENVAAIVGFGEAAYEAKRRMKKNAQMMKGIRDYIWQRLIKEVPNCYVNGDIVNRLPNNLNISFDGIEGSSLVLLLDSMGICVSAGSACTSGDLTPSHVLKAIGLSDEQANGSIRITVSEHTSLNDANKAIEAIEQCVERLRGC